MARQGITLTKHLAIEPRQHELFGIDLGEGPKRFDLAFGAILFVGWVALMLLIFGAPSPAALMLFILPPGLMLKFGSAESSSQPRRKTITQWVIRARYGAVGHRPVVNLGRKETSNKAYLPLSYRFQTRKIGHVLRPWTKTPEWENATEQTEQITTPIGSPIIFRQKSRLYGDDYMGELLSKAQAKSSGKKGRKA